MAVSKPRLPRACGPLEMPGSACGSMQDVLHTTTARFGRVQQRQGGGWRLLQMRAILLVLANDRILMLDLIGDSIYHTTPTAPARFWPVGRRERRGWRQPAQARAILLVLAMHRIQRSDFFSDMIYRTTPTVLASFRRVGRREGCGWRQAQARK